MLNYLRKLLNRNEIDFTKQTIKLRSCDIHDELIILKTTIGQFTLNTLDCSIIGNKDDYILFQYVKKGSNNRTQNFDLRVDNAPQYRENNQKIRNLIEAEKAKHGAE